MTEERERRIGTCDAPYDKKCGFADAAAERAVEKTFAILGVDVNKPEQVREFQESLRFGDRLRRAADRGVLAFVTSLVVALLAALWIGVKSKLGVN